MKLQNFIRNTILIILTIYFFLQISRNCSHYGIIEWIIMLWLLFCIYAAVICIFKALDHHSVKKKLPTVQAPDEPQKVEGVMYTETEHGIARADGKGFSDEEVPYLMERSYEKSLQREKELQKTNPAFNRTKREEDLAVRFMTRYEKSIPVWEKGFQDLYRLAFQEKDPNKRIEKLEQAAEVFIKTRTFFYNKSKGGQIYFQDMWECMHNSRSNCFSYLDMINNAIEEIKWEQTVVIPNLLETIRSNDGILQKDIYNKLPHIPKEEIQSLLKDFEHESIITRTKKGNSYELHIK